MLTLTLGRFQVLSSMCWRLARILIILGCLQRVLAIEHDSICIDNVNSNGEKCPEPSHTVLRLTHRNDQKARLLAKQYGLEVKGEPFLDGTYYFVHHLSNLRSRRRRREVILKLQEHPDVLSIEEQRPRVRRKRDYIYADNTYENFGDSASVVRRAGSTVDHVQNIDYAQREIPKLPFPDPLYKEQWYFNNGAQGGFDMNVRGAWLLGYAGRNVSVSILDDGIQRDHPDLLANYDPMASRDINDHDDDPTPQDNGDNKHGTRCAGEVASIAGNEYCGVGVAFHAKIGGVRMLDGPVSDSVEAASLSLNRHHIDIYSASWGPEDDGKTFDGPGPLAREAFYHGTKLGRGGKGSIFVWASGNGGSRQDSCSADGYTTSVYTLSISSATFDNRRPWYLEECPSTIATTYSSANMNQPAIVTVDVPYGCTRSHTGTSASAPIAAGIIALALEANPNLTWRDMQHIVLRTANPLPLLNNPGWSINGVGRRINNKFGYGLMDAEALVRLAQIWKTVPEQHMCTYDYKLEKPNPRPLTGNFQMNFSMEVSGCDSGTPVLYLEHVQVLVTIRFGKRGDLKLTLFSPRGTSSVLLPPRPQDFNSNGFHKWPFLSVQTWGEDPRGIWTLMVESVSTNRNVGGTFHDWSLLLYGTAEPAQPTDPRYSSSFINGGPVESLLGRVTQQLTSQDEEQKQRDSRDWQPDEDKMKPFINASPNLRISTTSAPISSGDLRSAENCHSECIGCSESRSAVSCFACRHLTQSLRNRAGFKCVAKCDEGYFMEANKCRACSPNCKTCIKAEQCETCPGVQLLIDVNHYGHLDHGQCVDVCPPELEPDYTVAVQARCVLRKNKCSIGYYESVNFICTPCDDACQTCHGPGPLQCDSCAPNFSNRSVGYCRPCCRLGDDPMQHHCEDCTSLSFQEQISNAFFSSFLRPVFIFITVLSICVAIVTCIWKAVIHGGLSSYNNRNVDYTPLLARNSKEHLVESAAESIEFGSDDEESKQCDYYVPTSVTEL